MSQSWANVESVVAENNTSTSQSLIQPSLSIVVPFYNEEGNIDPFVQEVHKAMANYHGSWEMVLVNDGSSDGTRRLLDKAAREYGSYVHVIHFTRNFGQTAAMQAGIDASRGQLIATLDGDLQNDPADIPMMVNKLVEDDLDLLTGWRKHRKDKVLIRKIPSAIANFLIRRTTGVKIQDYGCSLKIYRAEVIKKVHLIGEMHRFIPAWVACVTSPDRIQEVEVNHRPRVEGVSKYGISRTFRVVLDLLSVVFFMRFYRRPGHFFGSIGLALGSVGFGILAYLLALKIFIGADIGSRPLLFTGILLLTTGVQFITTGVLSELFTRTQEKSKSYFVAAESSVERAWHER